MRTTLVSRRAGRMLAAAWLGGGLLADGCSTSIDLTRPDLREAERSALVDSEPARRLLAELLVEPAPGAPAESSPRSGSPAVAPGPARLMTSALASDVAAERAPDSALLPDQDALRALAREVSVDFAALTFARALRADARSAAAQAAFARFLHEGAARSAGALAHAEAFPYTVLFAPAWLYRAKPETGADFADQRRLLDRHGIPNRLIPAGETESVEDNAATVATAIRAARLDGRPVIVVSASKSGAEVALALSRLLESTETAGVAAWINIAGALRGTPLADFFTRVPGSWYARALCWINGWNCPAIASVTTTASRQRLRGARIPEAITVVNVVAVPVTGSVGAGVYGGYRYLLPHGPNDGVVLLADTVWPGGVNLVALGADHLLSLCREDAYMLALLRAVDFAVGLRGAPSHVADRGAD